MPHVEGVSLLPGLRRPGESPFAGPVAAITAFVLASLATANAKIAGWQARRRRWALLRSSARKPWDVRAREAGYARATDLADLERMERDWDRRDGGGMRTWDWR